MNTATPGIFVLCDTETEYAHLMTEYLKVHRDIPWEIYTYTDAEELLCAEKSMHADLMAVAENAFTDRLQALQPKCLVILNESGMVRWPEFRNVNKYQKAEGVFRELLEAYMGVAQSQIPYLETENKTKLIGIYSPVRRCLQTSFALTMAQMLADRHRTLYLNFEHYAGITELVPDIQLRDMADLLYFLNTEGEKFRLRMQTIIQRKGKMDYIPPMKAGQNLLGVREGEWIKLLQRIEQTGGYDYVVLDLSECVQGLFEILHRCVRVFTLTKDDKIARSKLMQYEQLLSLCEYDDVLRKTDKLCISGIRRLPEEIELYTRGELAEIVYKMIREME